MIESNISFNEQPSDADRKCASDFGIDYMDIKDLLKTYKQ